MFSGILENLNVAVQNEKQLAAQSAPGYDVLSGPLTPQNFDSWSKAYVGKLNETLQNKFDDAVTTNAVSLAGEAEAKAQSKINSISQDAQAAYGNAVNYKKKIQKIFIFGAIGVIVFLMFNGKVKL